MAPKMVNHHKMTYPFIETMREELDFLQKALQPEANIKFKTPIAHMIPRPHFLAIAHSLVAVAIR